MRIENLIFVTLQQKNVVAQEIWYCTVRYGPVLSRLVLYGPVGTVWYRVVLYGPVWSRKVLYCLV